MGARPIGSVDANDAGADEKLRRQLDVPSSSEAHTAALPESQERTG